MIRWKTLALVFCGLLLVGIISGVLLIRHGFSAADEPSAPERILAGFIRNISIPRSAANEANPLEPSPELLREARDIFLDRCSVCHSNDGSGQSQVGRNLYPKPPDLRAPRTQDLTDGQLHYIIANGVRLTGMPAWSGSHQQVGADSWKLVLFLRDLRALTLQEKSAQAATVTSAHYVGSAACERCHAQIYARWHKTPMANVVRDPREHPEAIIPDLATNTVAKFSKDQIAFVYGSVWKQRYFTKVGDDYFPLGAQWDVIHKKWLPYFVKPGTDWWVPYYPADNMQRPTGPTCDGCHSVGYDIRAKQVAEWNVGCERCHGHGSDHVAHPTRGNTLNPARMDYVSANDTCIQCHSQGRPLTPTIEGKAYDWPVGYNVGLHLKDFWQLEDHTLGETTFTHFADGTAHKNRMQGNDFVQSVMYRRGIACFDCHDVHGTENYAQLRKPVDKLCLDCHGPMSLNGPHTATLEEHTHHKKGSAGSQCVACHMPKIETTIAGVFVRAHTFAVITPAMTEKYKIPNPCADCHADKPTSWATAALRQWTAYSPWRLN
jgi:predicted CXXCH cytochrome family protein